MLEAFARRHGDTETEHLRLIEYIEAGNQAQVAGRGHYGKDFAAALAEGSRFAVQFHPEKSHTHGLQLLQNFASWNGRW
mgnify:CR=1 FL=1